MSFMTERYFQLLETHKLYDRLRDEDSLRIFVENHVICVWTYSFLLRNIYQEIAESIQSVHSQGQKEAIRLTSELILEEEVEEQQDGTLLSHMEIYLEAMQELGADVGPVMCFFDLLESGKPWHEALQKAGFPAASMKYIGKMSRFFDYPLHERAAVLFYEGEPYIPDGFLNKLGHLQNGFKVSRLLDYFERHIEGLKRPGFSAIGRLVEIFCGEDENLNAAAEKKAEEAMKIRIEFWTEIADLLGNKIHRNPKASLSSLRLVTP